VSENFVISEDSEAKIRKFVGVTLDNLLMPAFNDVDYQLVLLHYLSGEANRRRRQLRRQRDEAASQT
jgi:hypothetical protein